LSTTVGVVDSSKRSGRERRELLTGVSKRSSRERGGLLALYGSCSTAFRLNEILLKSVELGEIREEMLFIVGPSEGIATQLEVPS
jgi:hypothetical protein